MLTEDNFPQSLRADLAIAYEEGRQPTADLSYRELIEVVPTTSSAKIEVFYGDKGKIRRFRGERQPQNFNEYKQTITLDDWEYTETIKRQVLDDDQSGGKLREMVGNFGRAVDISLQRETQEHLRRGTSYRGFDTNMFFGTHVYTTSSGATLGTPYTNFLTGGSQVAVSTIQAVSQYFAQLKSDTGNVFGLKLTHVGVKRGTDNERVAKEIANSQFTVQISTERGANTKNVFQGAFDIIPMDYGIGDTEWFAFDLSDPMRKPVKVLSHTISPGFGNLEYTQLLQDSDTGFWRNEFAFGVFGRFDWNPGDPRTAILYGSTTWVDPNTDLERGRVSQPNMV